MKYFHGGPAGLIDWILPASETGKQTTADDASRVYVVTHKKAAELFASQYSLGVVYEVEPVGTLKEDEDIAGWVYAAGERIDFKSFSCEKARIVRAFPVAEVVKKRVTSFLKERLGVQ